MLGTQVSPFWTVSETKYTQRKTDHSLFDSIWHFFDGIGNYLLFPNKATRAKNEVTVKLIRPGTI